MLNRQEIELVAVFRALSPGDKIMYLNGGKTLAALKKSTCPMLRLVSSNSGITLGDIDLLSASRHL